MKYDVNKKDYEGKKAIGYYSFLVTNCIQSYIEVLEVKTGIDNIVVYRALKAVESTLEAGAVRIAKINDKNQLNVYDYNKKRHTIAFSSILRA